MKLYRELVQQLHEQNFYVALIVTLACSLVGKMLATLPGLSLIGHLVIALLLGMGVQSMRALTETARMGTGYISNRFLRLGIILLGFKLNLSILFTTGLPGLIVACITVPTMICLTYFVCRMLRTEPTPAMLTACGCGICGAAAVMGVSAPLKAKGNESVVAIAIVCILGTVFTLIEVFLYPLLGFSPYQFGTMAGMTLHEIAHAVAAGGVAGEVGMNTAIITKLSRVLLLAPVALFLAHRHRRQNNANAPLPIPWFMCGFILASAIGTLLPLPASFLSGLVQAAYILLGMAMAALGIGVHFDVVIRTGGRPFLAAFISSGILLLAGILTAHTFF